MQFGGEGAPKMPGWLKEDNEDGATRRRSTRSKGGHTRPAWLTLAKWQSFFAKNRARSMRWWLQRHDENGQLAFDDKMEYTIAQAIDIQLSMNARAACKFDPSIEVALRMNLDQRFPDQQVRTSIPLPNGTGKQVRVAVFCTEEEADEVMAMGAFKCGNKLATEIQNNTLDFDVLLAKPQMMPRLAKLGKILGPKRLMPSPKSGTVVTDYAKAIKEFQGGTIELRTDRGSLINCAAGKLSFGRDMLIENVKAVLNGLVEKRPDGAKKEYFTSVFVGATMSPSIKIKDSEFPAVQLKKT